VITCFALGGIILMLVVFLNLAWEKIHEHQAADVKYRDLRLWGTDALQRILDERDSAYVADPEGMEKAVTEEEQRRQAERENIQRFEERQREIRGTEGKDKATGVPIRQPERRR
jgi:NAD(P)H-flavin reductase